MLRPRPPQGVWVFVFFEKEITVNRTAPKSRKVYVYLSISVALVAAFFALSVIAYGGVDDSEGKAEVKTPATLVGNWKQSGDDLNGITFTAEVAKSSIQINMETRDSSSIYWLGSFDTETDPASLFQVTSLGDTDAMSESLFGSRDKTKKFSYEDGRLSYEFKMMGTTKTVHLVKQ